jgi:hypothetical protein
MQTPDRPDTPQPEARDQELDRFLHGIGYCVHDGWIMENRSLDQYDLFVKQKPPRPVPVLAQLKEDFSHFSCVVFHLVGCGALAWGLYSGDWYTGTIGAFTIGYLWFSFVNALWIFRHGRLVIGRVRNVESQRGLIHRVMGRSSATAVLPPGERWPTVEILLPFKISSYMMERGTASDALLLVHKRPGYVFTLGIRKSADSGGPAED